MKSLITVVTLFSLLIIGCSESPTEEKSTEPVVDQQPSEVVESLTSEEFDYISSRLEEFKSLHVELNSTDLSDGEKIAELNKTISASEDFPDWFSKNTQEIRHIKLLKVFITDLGNGLATKNGQLIDIANDDFDRFSAELDSLLTAI